jgi:hypothetical protein
MSRNSYWKRALLAACALAGMLGLPSCGSNSSTTGVITAITITPSSASVGINTTADFTANVTLSNNTTLSSTTTSPSTAVSWEVNCITGGNSTVGTIVSSPTDNQVGIYTAPGIVPSTNNGQVTITASAAVTGATSSTCTSTGILYSNAATTTITVQLGVNISPTTAQVPAGGSFQFTALQNNLPDNNATWQVSSTNGGNVGSIDATGLYTAPLYPPPGAQVTITATDGANSATSVATITYSDASLTGPFAFSYSGGSGSNFLAVAGSFVSDGRGDIVSGVEDVTSPLTGTSVEIPIYSGSYVVQPDGRTNAVLTTARQTGVTWQFAMTTDQHALMILFNNNSTGSGTIDQQNLNDLTASNSVFTTCNAANCPYVFRVNGVDAAFNPQALAGYFAVNNSGAIPQAGTALDVNDNGAVATSFSDLNGSFAFDTAYNGTGRGTITLQSAATNHKYAFYVVDSTRVKLVEIDGNQYLAGDMLSAPLGNAFTAAELPSGNYAFTSDGTSTGGGYAAGGIFTSDGNGNISGGVFDSNNAGTVTANTTMGSCPYTVNSSTGRIDLKLFAASGTCAGPGATLNEFAAYPTGAGNLVVAEIDANAISSGTVRPQMILPTAPPVQAPVLGSFAMNFRGVGVSKNSNGAIPQAMEGQAVLNSTSVGSGLLDINNFNAVYTKDPISASTSSVAAASTLGRGTAVIAASDPAVSFSFIYYIVDNNTALVLDQDTVRVGTGVVARQF